MSNADDAHPAQGAEAITRGQEGPAVQPVSQIMLEIRDDDPDAAFRAVQQRVLAWIENKAGETLPDDAWSGHSFSLSSVRSQRTEVVSLERYPYWAARIDDQDRNVARRVWSTEIGLGQHQTGTVLFGCRLQCVSRGENPYFDRSIPAFVRDIAQQHNCSIGYTPVRTAPWFIDTPEGVEQLADLIRDPARRHEVIVFSLPEGERDPGQASADAHRVARLAVGAATVAVLTGPATFHLTDTLGRAFSVFHGAVRSYRPGCDPDQDPPTRHPLALPHTIAAWRARHQGRYETVLINNALRQSIGYRDLKKKIPPFAEVQRIARAEQRNRARNDERSDAELLQLAEQENDELKRFLEQSKEEYESLLETADREATAEREKRERLQAEVAFLRERVEQLEAHVRNQGGDVQPEIPETLDAFKDWVERHLAGRVEIHPRAHRGVKQARFENVPLIYRALLLLRDVYLPMRRSDQVTREQFDAACRELGLEEAPTFSGGNWGRFGDTYVVEHNGEGYQFSRQTEAEAVA